LLVTPDGSSIRRFALSKKGLETSDGNADS